MSIETIATRALSNCVSAEQRAKKTHLEFMLIQGRLTDDAILFCRLEFVLIQGRLADYFAILFRWLECIPVQGRLTDGAMLFCYLTTPTKNVRVVLS